MYPICQPEKSLLSAEKKDFASGRVSMFIGINGC
jgi:hypothetical protein